jgi:hypothetical protein
LYTFEVEILNLLLVPEQIYPCSSAALKVGVAEKILRQSQSGVLMYASAASDFVEAI